jgi:hypothetical protein
MRKKAEVETSAESFSESEENAAAAAVTRCSQNSFIGFSDPTDQPQELTYVDIDTFLSTF